MKIAIEGCAHGELDKIYESIELLESKENVKIDLLICCGDFQSTRNLQDLKCMAVPPKYQDICTFYKYYSGEKVAPYLTIFIGGNHEASNYLQELPYGGWVAPNIYYLGYAGVINVAGVRIGGISGIYKGFDYLRGHYEKCPYDESTKRSVYHIRNIEVFRLKQISTSLDIFLSHDWPKGITRYGNQQKLLKTKPYFKNDIESGKLGSPPCEELLNHLKPKYWFAAHLHCKFAALVPHSVDADSLQKVTKFLALDKCLPKRKFLQIVDIPHDPDSNIEIKYDLEWLTILFLTNHLLNIKNCNQYMPGPGSESRWVFTPTREEKDFVLEKIDYELIVPKNFTPTVPAYTPNGSKNNVKQPCGQTNIQTKLFCDKLGIDDPTFLVLSLNGDISKDESLNDSNKTNSTYDICNQFIPRSVEIKQGRLNVSLPDPKIDLLGSPKISKLSLTLPPPRKDLDENNFSSNTTETSSQESDISDSSLNLSTFSECDVNMSTPQAKKFKRRNESIYKIPNDT